MEKLTGKKKDSVIFGSTVELKDLENSTKKTYKIVGRDEADLKQNLIYFSSDHNTKFFFVSSIKPILKHK